MGFSTFRLIKLAVFSSLCVWREALVERHQTLRKPDNTLRHGGLGPRRMDQSKAHISNFCSLSSFCLDAAAAVAAAVILESACRCRLCGPSATVSAPPLGMSQVWKAQRRRGGLIFHASLHEEKLREACREASPPQRQFTPADPPPQRVARHERPTSASRIQDFVARIA